MLALVLAVNGLLLSGVRRPLPPLSKAVALPPHSIASEEPLRESITVQRVLVDVRVTDDRGEPVVGLGPDDFDVRIAKKPAIVEAAEWVDDTTSSQEPVPSAEAPPATNTQPPATAATPHRTIVLFVQTDFGRHPTRTQGQMNFLRYGEELLAGFGPDDRMAVFSFDSHLKFRLDLTSDKSAVLAALRRTLSIDRPAPPPIVPEPSLASHLDPQAMERAAHSETALLLVAHALRFVPGPKSLLLLGWGLGELSPSGVHMKRDWTAARRALDAARVSIFALDTSYADYHDLELGLMAAAEQTGGFYAKTHLFPLVAVGRLQRTLSGHYELTLRAAQSLRADTHALDVRAHRRGARVLAPSSVVIR